MWWRGRDLNPRPSGYEPDELPDCSTPRRSCHVTRVPHWCAQAGRIRHASAHQSPAKRQTEPRARHADAGAVVVVVGAVVVVDDGGGLEPEDGAGAVVEVVDGGGLVPPRSA